MDPQQFADGFSALMVFVMLLWGAGLLFGLFLLVITVRALLCVPKILAELRLLNEKTPQRCTPEELKLPYS